MQQDARHEAIIRMLLDRQAEDRAAREKRLLGYRQSIGYDSRLSGAGSPTRLGRFRTSVPCRVTPEARALLDQLTQQFSGCTIGFRDMAARQAVMLTGGTSTKPKQIGWVEHCIQSDRSLCNVRDQGLTVETDDGANLVLRFRYPPTPVRLSSTSSAMPRTIADTSLLRDVIDDAASVEFSEIRPALGARAGDEPSSPRVVWVTSRELETLDDLGSRDYDAFYMRLKLEAQAAIWQTLTALLPGTPSSCCHRGSYYTVLREIDVANGRIDERTVDDSGREIDIGLDRTYDAAAAIDILLLYLEADILADFADIYFTLQSHGSPDGASLKEEFFSTIHRFWADTPSLALSYDGEPAAVVRMAQRAVPAPAQASLLKQDWTNLRQSLVDRFGIAGRNAGGLSRHDISDVRVGPAAWPFASIPAGEVNFGLRVIYRHEWRLAGAGRGAIIRTVVPAVKEEERTGSSAPRNRDRATELRTHETIIERSDATRSIRDIVDEAASAMVTAMKWPRDIDGCINTGLRDLAARTSMGVEAEYRVSSRDTSTRLGGIMQRMADRIRTGKRAASTRWLQDVGTPSAHDAGDTADADETRVYSTLLKQYEVVTRPVEIQNVVMVAEELPKPSDIDLSWVERHDWILAKVLLDESFRDALGSSGPEAPAPSMAVTAPALYAVRDEPVVDIDTFSGTAILRGQDVGMAGEWRRGYRNRGDIQLERARHDQEMHAKRERLCEHIRGNILHYQRAIWLHEDPHQRSMRYRRLGTKVPLEWRFELEAGAALTIDELGDRLTAPNVDAQFAAYSGGPEADLDQLIDASAPLAYCGNCAVYAMRPEFGSADLFSMLHFFKSPWLCADPETGEPRVVEPVDIRTAGEHDIVTAGSERARLITVDTDDVVVDIIRRTAAAPANDVIDAGDVPDDYQLIAEGACGIGIVSSNGFSEACAEWVITPDDASRMPGLLAGSGSGAARAHDAAAETAVRPRSESRRLLASAGSGVGTHGAMIDVQRAVEGTAGLLAGAGAGRMDEPVIVAQMDRECTRGLLVRAGAAQRAARSIVASVAGARMRGLVAGVGAARTDARLTPPRGAAKRMVGRVHDAGSEGVNLTPAGAARGAGLSAGSGAAAMHFPEARWMIRDQDGEWLRPNLIAGEEVPGSQCWTGSTVQA